MKSTSTLQIFPLTRALILLLALSVPTLATGENAENGAGDGPVYLPMTPAFVVNVDPEDERHISFLKAEVTLRLHSTAQEVTVKKHMPWLRHELVTLFSRQKLSQVQQGTGQERLRKEALETLNQRLEEEAGEAMLRDLLFTTFVVQRR